MIFEIGMAGVADLSILRDRLGLDSGYMSRLLRALEGQGVIRVEKSADDGRARQARLTEAGEVEFAAYDALSDDLAQSMLSPLRPGERERLVAAMADIERL
ncbi:MAG: MarR family winged helix-turn-helix transcriptional regulator, partial [Pseudolabrys sp.]|nr:MarR family winged helix-turn-helix transcriptional regulator [Pseudolabrys sp.]